MNPRINVRNLPSPQAWGPARPGMAWHHVIPFSVLRDVWNRLVDRHIATQLPEARTAIRQYLLLCDPKLLRLDELIDRMRAENTMQRRASHHQLRPLDVAEANELVTAATWPAWNAVEGPSARIDDPGDGNPDRFTSGLTVPEAARMRAIERLFLRLRGFVSSGPAPGDASLRNLAQAVSAARIDVYYEHPIRFRPEMWEQEPNGRWRKRRDGAPYFPG